MLEHSGRLTALGLGHVRSSRSSTEFLRALQAEICHALEQIDGEARFEEDARQTEGGGLSAPRVLADGAVIERAGVNFTHSVGDRSRQPLPYGAPSLQVEAFRRCRSRSSFIHGIPSRRRLTRTFGALSRPRTARSRCGGWVGVRSHPDLWVR